MKTQTISQQQAKEILKQIPHTAFFGCKFTKKNGQTRKINCNKSISIGLKTKRTPISAINERLVVYDVNAHGFRSINMGTLSEITANKQKYIVK